MVPITVPIPGTIVPAAPPRSAPEIVRFLSAQALVCSHRSAGLVSASLVLASLVLACFVLAGLVLSFMLLPSVFLEERLDVIPSAASARRCDEAAPSTADALQTPSQMRRARRAAPARDSGVRAAASGHRGEGTATPAVGGDGLDRLAARVPRAATPLPRS